MATGGQAQGGATQRRYVRQEGPPAPVRGMPGQSMWRHPYVTNQPAPTNPDTALHPRLTVAYANAADRARLLKVLAARPGARLVTDDVLRPAVESLGRERASGRAALRACLDTVAARTMQDCDIARQELEAIVARRRAVLEGIEWATDLSGRLGVLLRSVESSRRELDDRRAEQRAAQQALDKVLEQRSAAAAAIEEADNQLREMADLGMDEGGLRRELEAAGQAVQEARRAHGDALAHLEEVRLERATAGPDAPPRVVDGVPHEAVRAVRDALDAVESATRFGATDPRVVTLIASWEGLLADLDEAGAHLDHADEAALADARRRVEVATAQLVEIDAVKAASAISAEERAVLDAAHLAVQEADDQGDRRLGPGARKRLAKAQEHERALLDRHGFGSYLEVVLTGGRAGVSDPARLAVEREVLAAARARDAIQRRTVASPALAHLRDERACLLEVTADLLGVDPGPDVLSLLRAHQAVGGGLQMRLADSLAAVGVRPVGMLLPTAARAFLVAHPLTTAAESSSAASTQAARVAELDVQVHAAQAEVDRTDEALQMAERSVATLESELSERSEADRRRIERFAAAEQLRTQITSVASTLRRAETETRRSLEQVEERAAAAEGAFEQHAAEVTAIAQRSRRLAEELPVDRRPPDVLRDLPGLVEALQDLIPVVEAEIEAAEGAAAAAAEQMDEALASRRLAGNGDGPMADDYIEGLGKVFGGAPGLVVLDHPFGEIEDQLLVALLETLRTSAVERQIVLLTEDPDVLGWAIDLPAEEAAADPADALLARLLPVDELDPQPVDVTSNVTDLSALAPEPASTARRWAGQR